MSERKSFWSTVPGLITGVAGTITGIVALVGVAAQAGWIGGGDGGGTTTTTTVEGSAGTIEGGRTTGPGATAPEEEASGELAVSPTSVDLTLLAPEATVTVRNTGDAPVDVRPPNITGSDADSFEVADDGCSGSDLDPGRSCEVTVRLDTGSPGDYQAVLVVSGSDLDREVEVSLRAGLL